MNNKIFLSTKSKLIEIKDDELKINGLTLKEKQEDGDIEYKLSDDMNEKILSNKALEITQTFYIKSLEKLVSAEKLLVLTGAGSSKDDKLFGGKLMWELWKIISELKNQDFNFELFLDKLNISQDIRDKSDLEMVLSKAKLYLEFKNDATVSNDVKTIEETILKECSFSLNDKSIHLDFIKKLINQ